MILQEADFLNVNLKTMVKAAGNNASTAADSVDKTSTTSTEASMPTNQEDNATHKAWSDLLLSRLAENRKLSGEAKKPEAEITDTFFEEYFKKVWGEAVGSLLVTFEELLTNDIQKLGFDINKNPLLAFISQRYVSENLIATKLLNKFTYAALHNAIAKKLVAQSEFRSKRNYNIIYCRSFYNHRPVDMVAYLKLQAKILDIGLPSYTLEIQKKNRQAFLQLLDNEGETAAEKAKIQISTELKRLPHTLDAKTKLNKLDVVQEVLQLMKITVASDAEEAGEATASDLSALAKELSDKPAEQAALMQHLLVKTDVGAEEIKAFLMQDKFTNLALKDIVAASVAVKKRVKGMNITKSSIKYLIKALSKQ